MNSVLFIIFHFLSCTSHLSPLTTISIIQGSTLRASATTKRNLASFTERERERATRMTNSSRRCKWELSSRVSTRKRDWEWIRFPANKMHFWTIIHHVMTRIVSRFAPISRSADETLFVFVSSETLLAAFCLAIVGRLIPDRFRINGTLKFQGFIAPDRAIVQARLDAKSNIFQRDASSAFLSKKYEYV